MDGLARPFLLLVFVLDYLDAVLLTQRTERLRAEAFVNVDDNRLLLAKGEEGLSHGPVEGERENKNEIENRKKTKVRLVSTLWEAKLNFFVVLLCVESTCCIGFIYGSHQISCT